MAQCMVTGCVCSLLIGERYNMYDSLLFLILEGAFIESPTSQNVSIGEDAVFRCQHDSADTIRWRVNGVLVSRSSPPTGVHEDADGLVDTLTITGSLEYNGTEVVCVAQFDSGSPDQESTPAYLHVHVTGVYACVYTVITNIDNKDYHSFTGCTCLLRASAV